MNRFSKEAVQNYFEQWDGKKEEIEQLYANRSSDAVKKLEEAITQYEALLAYGGTEVHPQTNDIQPILLPLNGEERLAFIKKQIRSHYAFVQLDALYDETRKKAARLAIMRKKQ